MNLGTRRIRSAGRSSGSIEITLPADLQGLEGVECRLSVRDGSQPEIVLQPDLSVAHALFQEVWGRLRLGLGDIDDIGEFSLSYFDLALFPPRHWQERPPLAYVDAYDVVRERDARGTDGLWGQSDACPRLIGCLALGAGYRLGLTGAPALAFGDSVAYLLTGTSPGLGADFERGMAHLIFWGEGRGALLGSPFQDATWLEARTSLRRVYDRFRAWQDDPRGYLATRASWYRALAVDVTTESSVREQSLA